MLAGFEFGFAFGHVRVFFSCQDFIGHMARLSRRVSPVTNSLRTLQRYLTKAMGVFKDAMKRKRG